MAKSLIDDLVNDLDEYAMHDIDTAIREYRQNPKNRFFPTSGQLRELAQRSASERRAREKYVASTKREIEFGESRPIYWWVQPKRLWKSHWSEADQDEKKLIECRSAQRRWDAGNK